MLERYELTIFLPRGEHLWHKVASVQAAFTMKAMYSVAKGFPTQVCVADLTPHEYIEEEGVEPFSFDGEGTIWCLPSDVSFVREAISEAISASKAFPVSIRPQEIYSPVIIRIDTDDDGEVPHSGAAILGIWDCR